MVGGLDRAAVHKYDLVLPGSLLVVRALRLYTHFLKRQTDFAAYVLALIYRGDIVICAVVMRRLGGVAVFVEGKKVELAFCAYLAVVSKLAQVVANPPRRFFRQDSIYRRIP